MRSVLQGLCCAQAFLLAQGIEPLQLQEDLRVLKSALEEGHPGIYRYTPKAEVDRAFAAAEERLNRQMTPLEFYRILAPTVATLKCGHTAMGVSQDIQQTLAQSFPLIPIEVRVLKGKVYVFRDYSPSGALAGAEIFSVNGISTAKLLATMLAVEHGDGDTPTAGPWRIGHGGFNRDSYLLAGIESPFRIRYVLRGKAGDTTLEGMPQPRLQEIATTRFPEDKRPTVSATYKRINHRTVGVLKIYGFGGKAEGDKPLDAFYQDVYNDLSERKIQDFIIDVRDNGGGADELGRKLFGYLVTEPFQYYNDLVINKLTFDFFKYANKPSSIPESEVTKRPNGKYLLSSHENWGTQQPGKPYFGGKVFALTNGGSFSTTCEFLSTLHNHHRATFIGEEGAGGYYGNTSGPGAQLVLPNSKLRIGVRLMTYYMAIEGSKYGNRSIPVDHEITYSIAELLAGKDKEMDLALRLIER